MRIAGISIGLLVWIILLCMSVPTWMLIGGAIVILLGGLYGLWCNEYINQRYIQFIADGPEDKDKWFREYKWQHPISTFFFELGGNE